MSEKEKSAEEGQDSGNVISLLARRLENQLKKKDAPSPPPEEKLDLIAAMEFNQKNIDRIKKERLQQNKSVLRSYRIKS